MQKPSSTSPAVKRAFETLDDKQKSTCKLISNLYSIVLTLDALETAYVQGRLQDDIVAAKKKSLVDQFKSCIKISSSTVSEDQFFRDYFPNGEHSLGVNILQDVEGKIQTLRDETIEAFNNLNNSIQRIRTKKVIFNAIQVLDEKIKKCIEYAHKSFDYHDSIEEMIDKLNEDDCDDDSNIQDSSILAMITNIKDELQQNFQQIKFLSVCCC